MGKVVHVSNCGDGVLHVRMEDRNSKNTFSTELIEGLIGAFDRIDNDEACKVVVISGYENYFCCGGTQDELRSIYRKELQFNKLDFYSRLLTCPVPVCAAMQGHALGGGLVFGLYADIPIMGKENIYTCNFMKYGFTPGMGATLVVPHKMGETLGQEMLLTAAPYRGGDLQLRGAPLRIVRKADVLSEAFAVAKQLAEKPRLSLVTLKDHLTQGLRDRLDLFIQKELRMHEITFHQPEVLQRIESLFGQ